MAILNSIPAELQEKLNKLSKLDESAFQSLIKALDNAEVTISTYRVAEQLATKIKEINPIDLKDIIRGVSVFIDFDKNRNVNIEDVIDQLVKLFEAEDGKKIKFVDKKESDRFKERIRSLLNHRTLILSQKASDIYYSHKNLFGSAAITTDIRPIFYDGESKYAVTSIVFQIEFQSGEQESIYIAMDRNDIKILKKIITEAEQKLIILESTFEKMNLKELRLDEEQNK